MQRTASIFSLALGISVMVVATTVWLASLAGEAVMAYVLRQPDGPIWVPLLTPVLSVFSFAVFGLVVAARRRKMAKVGSDAAAR